jgi:hypothetical protein
MTVHLKSHSSRIVIRAERLPVILREEVLRGCIVWIYSKAREIYSFFQSVKETNSSRISCNR